MTSLRDPLPLPCGQILPNRIMKAALSEALGDKRNAPDERLERCIDLEPGGYGLIVTGNIMVDRAQLGEPGNIVIEDDRDLPRYAWTKPLRTRAVDLGPAQPPRPPIQPLGIGHQPVAPSAVPLEMPGATTPRELTSAEIEEIIERFATAAAVCERPGSTASRSTRRTAI